MPVLHRDIETRSTVPLKAAGPWRYAADASTEVLCVAYAVDAEPVQLWTPGQLIPTKFITASTDPDWIVVAHNDEFESAIEQCLLAPRYGWPLVPIERHRCTMAMASATALPASLEKAAAALNLAHQKDAEGHRLMMLVSKPRKARKGEDPTNIYWHNTPELRARLYEYCKQDVEVERELCHQLPPLCDDEQTLWCLDATINQRGFHVDHGLAVAAQSIAAAEQDAVNQAIKELTAGAVTSANQVARILSFARANGHNIESLSKRAVAAVLAHDNGDATHQLLELRRRGARAAARKLETLLASADDNNRVRGTLRFHGASTGRWSGSRFQPQNLKRPETKDLDAAITAVRTGELDSVRALGDPLSLVGDLSRAMICAAPGHILVGADFSAIESRVLAWLAGEEWKLETYRQYDASGDPSLEPYCTTATKVLKRPVTPDDDAGRQTGKTCDLAFGYGGGLGAWRKFDHTTTHSDAEVEKFKTEWRAAHEATVRFWHALDRGMKRAIRSGQQVTLGQLACVTENGTLYLTLPSGRRLAYPEARLEEGKHGPEIAYKDNARGGWSDMRGWYGTFTENVVQAVARDLLAAAMLRLDAAGYPIVLHVHDEIVAEIPNGDDRQEDFLHYMIELPGWAEGLPIAAKAWTGERYVKTRAAEPPAIADDIPPPWDETDEPLTVQSSSVEAPAEAPTENEAQVSLADVIGRELVNGKVLCPFHAEHTPSCHIYPDGFHCFGCGAHGDALTWLIDVEGMHRDKAVELLQNWDGPRTVERGATDDDGRMLRHALRLWDAAVPIAGTLAEKYLAETRGIDPGALPGDLDRVLRFHPRCPFNGGNYPSLVALFRDVVTDEPAGIHRTALTAAGEKIERRMLGSWPAPRAIKIWPAGAWLFVGEGVETVLAATHLHFEGAPMVPAWATGTAGSIAKFPIIPGIERLVILADNDPAGISKAKECARRWKAAGREVTLRPPSRPGTDYNDVLKELRSEARV